MSFSFSTLQSNCCRIVIASAMLWLPASCALCAPQPEPAPLPTTTKASNPFAVKDEADFFALLDLKNPELAAVKVAVDRQDWSAAKVAWAKHLETRSNPRWVWSHTDTAAIQKVFAEKFGGFTKSVPGADKILNREFSSQGVTKTLEKHPTWIQGTGEWTNVLNRFPFFQTMGEAYWATGDKKYAADFVLLLEDWIAKNPVPDDVLHSAYQGGTSWRTLETGIRIQSWFNAMQFFMDAPEFDAEAKYEMTRSLVEHARRLNEYEIEFRSGNWQVVECTGLASVGMMLPELRESAGWRERSFKYLVQHMQRDVYADGGHSELTPVYHIWVMNEFLDVALLARKNGYEVPGLLDRHEKMYEFLQRLSRPDRRLPGVGDSSALTVKLDLGIGALLYNRPDFRFLAVEDAQPEWVWRFGPDVVQRYVKLAAKQPDFLNTLLPQSQYSAMRSGWSENDRYLFFDAGPWGGNHNHQDRLQLELYAGRPLLVDPGQYSYDRPLSGYFRSAPEHNVLLIDGDQQIQADPKMLAWQDAPNASFVSAQIEDKALRHQRSVLWVQPNYWVVVDHVNAVAGATDTTEHELTRLFHFPLSTVKADGNSLQTAFADGTNLQIQGDATLQMREDWVPIGGASAKKAPVAAFVSKGKLPMTLCSVLMPFTDSNALPKVEWLPTSGATAHLRLAFLDGHHEEIVVATEPSKLSIGGHESTGRALIVQSSQKGDTVITVP